jgi:hypothetical protein
LSATSGSKAAWSDEIDLALLEDEWVAQRSGGRRLCSWLRSHLTFAPVDDRLLAHLGGVRDHAFEQERFGAGEADREEQ